MQPPIVQSTLISQPDFRPLVERYIADLPPIIARIHDLLAQDDMIQLARQLHRLKGSGGGYGFAQLSILAAEAEKAVAAGQCEVVESAVAGLVNYIRSIAGYCREAETQRPG